MKVGAHVRHVVSGKSGTIFGLWSLNGVKMVLVCWDGSAGREFGAYAEDQWEAA